MQGYELVELVDACPRMAKPEPVCHILTKGSKIAPAELLVLLQGKLNEHSVDELQMPSALFQLPPMFGEDDPMSLLTYTSVNSLHARADRLYQAGDAAMRVPRSIPAAQRPNHAFMRRYHQQRPDHGRCSGQHAPRHL